MWSKKKQRRSLQKRYESCLAQQELIQENYKHAYRRAVSEGYKAQRALEHVIAEAEKHGVKLKEPR